MKQMVARLDDKLHARVKRKAAAQGRSMNDFVARALEAALEEPLTRETLRERIRAAGKLVIPPAPAKIPTREELARATQGTGTSVSEALEADRGRW